MRTFSGVDDLLASVGEQLGPTDWILIDQDRIDRFADATNDHQWIHVDPARAAAGPYGAPRSTRSARSTEWCPTRESCAMPLSTR